MARLSVGDWELRAPIGKGAHGDVWEAVHPGYGMLAAIKLIRCGDLARELHALARIEHPHVIRVFDAGKSAAGAWIAMELARGPVREVRDAGQLYHVLKGVLLGLAVAHASDLLHLDIKPDNILQMADGRVVLADFSTAVRWGRDGLFGGTPAYMAPELFEGRADPRSDLYAVGCLAYAYLAGRPPFPSGPWDRTAEFHQLREPPAIITSLDVSPDLTRWVFRLLSKRPDHRFYSAAEALAALEATAVKSTPSVAAGALLPPSVQSTVPTLSATVELADDGICWATVLPTTGGPALPREVPRWPAPDPSPQGLGLLGLRPIPFTARDGAVAALWGMLLEVERTRTSLTVSVDGPPGVGASRLIEYFVRLARTVGCGGSVSEGRIEVAGAAMQLLERAPRADRTLWLDPLQPSDCRVALGAWVAMEPRLVSELAWRCDGDLDLAAATVHHNLRRGALQWQDGQLCQLRPLELCPERMRWWARRVPPPDTIVAPAVLAPRFSKEDLVAVDPSTPLEELRHRRLIVEQEGVLRWASGALPALVERSVGPARWRALHLRAAQLRHDPWDRGVHLLRAGRAEEAAQLLLDGVVQRSAQGQMVETEAILRALLGQVADTPAWRARALYALARLGPTHLGYLRAEAYTREAVALFESLPPGEDRDRRLGAALGHMAWLCCMRAMPNRAWAYHRRSLAFQEQDAGICQHEGLICINRGNYHDALEAFRRAARLAAERGRFFLEQTSWGLVAIVHREMGAFDEALELGLQVWGRLTEAGFFSAHADLATHFAETLIELDRYREALAWGQEAVRLAHQGQARADVGMESTLARCYLHLGDVAVAEALLMGCLRRLREEGPCIEGELRAQHAALPGVDVDAERLRPTLEALDAEGFVSRHLCHHAARIVEKRPDLVWLEKLRNTWEERLRQGGLSSARLVHLRPRHEEGSEPGTSP